MGKWLVACGLVLGVLVYEENDWSLNFQSLIVSFTLTSHQC